jgi:hypothetical protein
MTVAAAQLGDTLTEYVDRGFSGGLRVDGQPGGRFFFADGGVCGCETPGAPGLEVVLLRSGRVSEQGWNTAYAAAAVAGSPVTSALVTLELLGAGETEALLRTALADAVFAILSGQVGRWSPVPGADCPLPLSPATHPGWLVAEARRRGQVLGSFPGPPLSPRDRPVAVYGATSPARPPGPDSAELRALANGRRTVRDLAFTRGRGLYETMLELARLRADNLVSFTSYQPEAPSQHGIAGVPSDPRGNSAAPVLPQRHADRSGIPRSAEAGRRKLVAGIALLRPRSAGRPGQDGRRDPSG